MEAIIQKAIEECSLVVNNILDQPSVPESEKLRISVETLLEETARLNIPQKIQAMLLSTIFVSVVAPHMLKQKCLGCQAYKLEINNPEIGTPEDRGLEGMFA